jgi:hypothetical protein
MCGHSTSVSSLMGKEVFCENVAKVVLANNVPIQDLVTVGNADIAKTGYGFSLSTMTDMENWVLLADNSRCATEILQCIANPINKVIQTDGLKTLVDRCSLTVRQNALASIPAIPKTTQRELVRV